MFDTMTLTKVVGAVCGSLLVLLLGKWAAETLYHVGAGGHGEEHAQAYTIDTGSEEAAGAETETVDLVAVLAAGDADKGAKVFSKCSACHKLEKGANATGPYLHGIVGRAVDAAEGFSGYSGALEKVADVWSPEHLYAFLENPKGFAPGTKMAFAGLKKSEDRADLIAYLATIN
ncbi:MAG TPA: cytochrome c family protein [Rhodobacteraceae bacterium]|jgi:cytochrome c|nr:cytochrome c family protein [Paracoccaceae bacterium]HBV56269.1 cytochrome c family protein [Paracoccaceae bacterium]